MNRIITCKSENPAGFITRTGCPGCNCKERQELYSCMYTDEPIKSLVREHYANQGGVEEQYLEGIRYILLECQECGMVYQRDIPDWDLLNRLYEHWIDPEHALARSRTRFNVRDYEKFSHGILNVMKHFRKPPGELMFMDYGMGLGHWCRIASSLGCDVHGVDISSSRIEHSGKLGIPAFKPEELGDYKYDLIHSNQVFEHLPEPLEVLRELAGHIKDDGLIWITVPGKQGIKRKLRVLDWGAPTGHRNSLNCVFPLEHLNCFSTHALIRMAQSAGLVPTSLSIANVYLRNIMYTTIWDIARPLAKRITGLGVPSMFFKKA